MDENKDQGKKENELEKRTMLRDIINLVSLTGFLYGALDERLQVKDAIEHQLNKPTPHYRYAIERNLLSCLGGISFVLFMVQVVTGIMLLMYYRPTAAEAYKSVVEITNIVPFGWLIRGMHHWAANIMVITVMAHLARVFFVGAYKPPRDFNWLTGVILFLITLTFGFSGYLLPWNQISYWATTVGTEGAGAIPYAGGLIKYFIRGGNDVGQITLTRFFAIHVVILPTVTFFMLVLHFSMIRRQGISDPL